LSVGVDDISATTLAVAVNIASVIRRVPAATIPSPMPGKMFELLVWSIGTFLPFHSTVANGLPVPISARRSVEAMSCSAVGSLRQAGLAYPYGS